jgi:hypothetical protein
MRKHAAITITAVALIATALKLITSMAAQAPLPLQSANVQTALICPSTNSKTSTQSHLGQSQKSRASPWHRETRHSDWVSWCACLKAATINLKL